MSWVLIFFRKMLLEIKLIDNLNKEIAKFSHEIEPDK